MLPITRRQRIREYVQEKKSATVLALAAMYGVTDETIRRDLKALEKEGALLRTYGLIALEQAIRRAFTEAEETRTVLMGQIAFDLRVQ